MFYTVGLVLASVLVSGTWGQCLTKNDNLTTSNSDWRKAFAQARMDFALDVLGKAAQLENSRNVFLSPHSLHQALTLAYVSTRGTTEDLLRAALRTPDGRSKADARRFLELEDSSHESRELESNGTTNHALRTANKIWITSQRRVKPCVPELLENQVEQVDFTLSPDTNRLEINEWVGNVTEGRIGDLLAPGSITAASDLVLANAVYFKGFWQNRFDPTRSKMDYFHSNGTHQSLVRFMRQEGEYTFGVSDEFGAYVVELPYEGGEASMYLLLPLPMLNVTTAEEQDEMDRIGKLVHHMTTTEKGRIEIQKLLDAKPNPLPLRITLPAFSLDKSLPLGDLLTTLGAGELFTDKANLTGLLDEGEPSLHLNDAVHRAKIEVTEEGTTAAAATAIISQRMGTLLLRFNRPFSYLIYEKPSRSVLFAGIYRSPPSE